MNEYTMEQAEIAAYEVDLRFNPETLEYEPFEREDVFEVQV